MIDPELPRRLMTAARKGKEWIARRDELIRAAIESGASQREVAKYAGLTQPAISNILSREQENRHVKHDYAPRRYSGEFLLART